jgi:5-methylcytosine-specific restriction endonuclease McrA
VRLCSGCQTKVADAVRFCDACKAERGMPSDGIKTHTTGYDAALDELRKSARWQKTRSVVIKRDPLCKRCDVAGSEIVDHIVPAAVAIMQASGRYPFDKYAGYFLKSNLQGLCRSCHGLKTTEDKCHVGPWPDVVAIEAAAPKKVWSF